MPNNCWDDIGLQEVLDAIHAEIKEFDFSKTWHGSVRVYESLKFHLHRMYGYAPFDIKQSPEQLQAGLISVQFSGPAEQKIMEAEMQAPPRDLTQRPAGPVNDVLDAVGYGIQHKASPSDMPFANLGLSYKPENNTPVSRTPEKNTPVSHTPSIMWCRRGQFSIRVSAVTAISPVKEKSLIIFLDKAHLTMKFSSKKAAQAARNSLVKAVNTGRP